MSSLGRGHQHAGDAPAISVVVPTHEGSIDWIEECLQGLLDQETSVTPEVILVLDGPAPAVSRLARGSYPAARQVSLPDRRGFAQAATLGLRSARGALVALLNDDAVPEPGWIAAMLDAAERHPDAGSFASRVLRYGERGEIDSAGHGLTRWGEPFAIGAGVPDGSSFDAERAVFGAPACASVYRKELLQDCGGLDGAMEAYLEDVDLSLRAQVLGFPCWYVPQARVQHRGSASYGWGGGSGRAERLIARNRIRLLCRSMPRAALRAGAPAAATSIGLDILQRSLRGRHGVQALLGTLEGLRSARAALSERAVTLGRRRVDDAGILEVLRDSEEQLQDLARSPRAGQWTRRRASLARMLGTWTDRRERRMDRSAWLS